MFFVVLMYIFVMHTVKPKMLILFKFGELEHFNHMHIGLQI